MNRFKRRWLVLGAIWCFVLVVSGWNIARISQIQNRRQALEMIKIDQHYLNANEGNIHKIQAQKKRLVHEVGSFGLGFLVVENDLKKLSAAYHLKKMQIEVKAESHGTSAVPIHVRANGNIPDLTSWLSTVEESFPYLSIAALKIVRDQSRQTGQLTAKFTYRYAVSQLQTGETT
jgi:hypothetical protein